MSLKVCDLVLQGEELLLPLIMIGFATVALLFFQFGDLRIERFHLMIVCITKRLHGTLVELLQIRDVVVVPLLKISQLLEKRTSGGSCHLE